MRLFNRLCELCKQGDWLIDQYCSEKLLCCVKALGGYVTKYSSDRHKRNCTITCFPGKASCSEWILPIQGRTKSSGLRLCADRSGAKTALAQASQVLRGEVMCTSLRTGYYLAEVMPVPFAEGAANPLVVKPD